MSMLVYPCKFLIKMVLEASEMQTSAMFSLFEVILGMKTKIKITITCM